MLAVFRYFKLTSIIREACGRFPLPMAAAIALTSLWLAQMHGLTGPIDAETFGRLVIIMAQSVLWFTASRLWAESRGLTEAQAMLKSLVGFAVVAVATLMPQDLSVSQGFFSFALLLSVLFAPYFGRESTDDSIWFFCFKAGIAVFYATLTVLIFGLGISAILASVDYLFEVRIAGVVYGDVWALGWGFFWPLYILYSLPRSFDYPSGSFSFSRGVAFIENYVLVPLVLIYTAVLYAYFLKIAATLEVPKGQLAYMISGFGAFGVCVWLVVYPLRSSGTRLLGWFWRHFFKMLLVPVVALLAAAGMRIAQYGVTEERYAIVLCAVWLGVLSLYYFLSSRRDLKAVPMTLAFLCLLASFGPWGADRLSTASQVGRLERLLTDNGMMQDGRVVRASAKLSIAAQKDISSILDYLISRNKFKPIEVWFSGLSDELRRAGVAVDKCFYWGDVACPEDNARKFVEVLGLDYVPAWQADGRIGFDYADPLNALGEGMVVLDGFDYATQMHAYFSQTDWTVRRHAGGHEFGFHLDRKAGILTVAEGEGRKVSFSLSDKVAELRLLDSSIPLRTSEGKSSLVLDGADGGFKVRLMVSRLYGDILEGDRLQVTGIEALVLIGVK